METRTIFFIGKPGSGKDTQAELLSQATGWRIISAGDQFRALATKDSFTGRRVRRDLESGALAPDWIAVHLFFKSALTLREDEGIIFDGFSRERSEAEMIAKALSWLGRSFKVILINVSDDTVRARLEGRAKVAGRNDDHVVETRLKEFYTHTMPAIALFRSLGALIEIDGEPLPGPIAAEVRRALQIA